MNARDLIHGVVMTHTQDTGLGAAPHATRHTVLLVDDEPNVLSALRRHFIRLRHYSVLEAQSAPAALVILAEHPVHVIITDMRMPVMSGADLLRVVAQRWPTIARVLLTGYADLSVTTTAIREGLLDHLTKPWEPQELLDCVEQAMTGRRVAQKVGR